MPKKSTDNAVVLEAEILEDQDYLPSTANLISHSNKTERLVGESLKTVMDSYVRYYALGEGHTARAKRYDLQYFLEFLAGTTSNIDRIPVSAWTLQATKDYIENRLELGESPSTVSRRLATLKHFGRTLAERFPNYINPAREAKGPTIQPTKPHGLSEQEIELLRKAAALETQKTQKGFNAYRNRFLLELLLATGIRADEARVLCMAQVGEGLDWLKNVKTKGKKFRNVYLDSNIRDLFRDYLIRREEAIIQKYPGYSSLAAKERGRFPVVVSLYQAEITRANSFGLSPKSVWRVISELGKAAQALSVSKVTNLHPHLLRHTFAHGLLDSSKDVRLVAQALGHSDVRTTMRYTERTEDEIAKAIVKKIESSPLK